MRLPILIVLYLYAFSASGQFRKFSAGGYTGVNYGKVKTLDPLLAGIKSDFGYSAGITAVYHHYPCLGFVLMLGYDKKNAATRTNKGSYHLRLNYFNTQLQLASVYDIGRHYWNFNPGVFYGRLLNAADFVTGTDSLSGIRRDVSARCSKYDWGVSVSTGPAFYLGKKFLLKIDFRYTRGFKNINEFGAAKEKMNTKYFSSAVSLLYRVK